MRSLQAIALTSVLVFASPAFGQDVIDSSLKFAAPPIVVTAEPAHTPVQRALLVSMYVGNASLQGYDAYSTLTALRRGAVEANPFMQTLTKSTAGVVALKVGVAALTVATAERMWRNDHRVRAIVLVALNNALMGVVAAHNHAVLRQLDGRR